MLAEGTESVFPRFACDRYTIDMIADKSIYEPLSIDPLPGSNRVYLPGKLHPELRVPFRQIQLGDSKSFNGRSEPNEPLRVYDCSGPWGDPDYTGTVETGLPALRQEWIHKRGDVETMEKTYRPIPGRSETTIPDSLKHLTAPSQTRPGRHPALLPGRASSPRRWNSSPSVKTSGAKN